jgi:diguanylate cyclase (GGDEF)-like protein
MPSPVSKQLVASWVGKPWEALRALPISARVWWLATVLVAILLAPTYLAQVEPDVPLLILVLAPVLNAVVVLASAPRRFQTTPLPTFDYGGIATVALLAAYGPAGALPAFLGEKLAAAFVPDASRRRPSWIKSVYNVAWGIPCIVVSWGIRGLAPDRTLEPVFIAAAWWLINGLLVGVMAGLAQRRSVLDGVRLGLTREGWLRLQEGLLSLLAVVVWRTNPLLLVSVVLLVVGQAVTVRRLFREYGAAAQARELALHDPLTFLPNRRALEVQLDALPIPAGVLMLDLDHFKRVNDTFGHAAGDRVLTEVAKHIQETLDGRAFCARVGGEEFCALLAEVRGEDELLLIANQLRLLVKSLRFSSLADLQVTLSVGAARPLAEETTARESIMRADRALYRAKREGRDRVCMDSGAYRIAMPLAS